MAGCEWRSDGSQRSSPAAQAGGWCRRDVRGSDAERGSGHWCGGCRSGRDGGPGLGCRGPVGAGRWRGADCAGRIRGAAHLRHDGARLVYGEGYAVAQDRLWQAEQLRLTGTGTVAAVHGLGGPGSVPGDLKFREYTGGEGHLRALVRALPAPAQVAVQAFSDGMNSWIRTAIRTHTLPPEYAIERLTPRPWTPEDVLATWFVLEGGPASTAFQYGSFGGDEVTNAAQLARWTAALGAGAAAKVFADTHWLNDP